MSLVACLPSKEDRRRRKRKQNFGRKTTTTTTKAGSWLVKQSNNDKTGNETSSRASSLHIADCRVSKSIRTQPSSVSHYYRSLQQRKKKQERKEMTAALMDGMAGNSRQKQRREFLLRRRATSRIAAADTSTTKDIVANMRQSPSSPTSHSASEYRMVLNRRTVGRRHAAGSVATAVSLILLPVLLLLLPAFDAYVLVPTVSTPATPSSTRQLQYGGRRRHQPWKKLSVRPPSCCFRLQSGSSSSNTDEDRHQQNDNNNNNNDPLQRMSAEDVRGRPSGVLMEDLDWRLMKLKLEEENTRRFLKAGPRFLPYGECRKWVQAWGHFRTQSDWNYWIESGEKRNSYIPSRPEEYYTKRGSWISWAHFLGVDDDDCEEEEPPNNGGHAQT